jgi:hypothetical protein
MSVAFCIPRGFGGKILAAKRDQAVTILQQKTDTRASLRFLSVLLDCMTCRYDEAIVSETYERARCMLIKNALVLGNDCHAVP